MLKKLLLLLIIFGLSKLSAQEVNSLYQQKKVVVIKDTINLDNVSISPSFFKIQKTDGTSIDSSFYKVDFKTGRLIFKNGYESKDSLTVRYFKYPEYLTKT